MSAPSYEWLEDRHFVEWGDPRPADEMLGFALRGADGRLMALGGVWWLDGEAWGFFDSRADCSPWVHRMAVRVVSAVFQAGERELFALCDETRPRARAWLERLGFVERGEVWALNVDGVQRSIECGKRPRRDDPGQRGAGCG